MAGGYLRHQKKQIEKILSTTETLCREEGIDAVSITDIADRCGITKNTVYNYFGSKEEILWAVFFHQVQDFVDRVKRRMETATNTYERFEAYALANEEKFFEDPNFPVFQDMFRTIYASASEKPDDFWDSPFNTSHWKPNTAKTLLVDNFHDGSVKADLDPELTVAAFTYGFLSNAGYGIRNKETLKKYYDLDAIDVVRLQMKWMLDGIKA